MDPLLNKAQPIRSVLQRFNKKDSATSEEPDERDLRDLMKFVEDDTLKGLCKHLFAASGAMFSVATHIMTLETLFSHPAEYAKRHRESPEVQSFKQNPSRESMVAYIASQTLSHTEAVAEDEPAGSIWDTLTQRGSSRQARQTSTFWDVIDDNPEEEDADYEYDDEPEEDIRPPMRRRQRSTILDDEDEENEEDEPFNTPESSAEHALFIMQPDPEDYHEPGTLSRAEKGKAPASRKRPSATSYVWARFGFSADTTSAPATSAPPAIRKQTTPRTRGTRPTRATTRGRARGSRGKRGHPTARHIYFD